MRVRVRMRLDGSVAIKVTCAPVRVVNKSGPLGFRVRMKVRMRVRMRVKMRVRMRVLTGGGSDLCYLCSKLYQPCSDLYQPCKIGISTS